MLPRVSFQVFLHMMSSFNHRMVPAVDHPGTKGWLVAILELGAWFGVLMTGYFADELSRTYTIVLAVVVLSSVSSFRLLQKIRHLSMEVQLANTGTRCFLSPLSGRFVTGMGVGSLSKAVPLYNAEIAPPEVRGSLVALQLAIMFGIMISFWIDYGTNYIGGTGAHQHEAAWKIPLALQLVPAVVLGVGIMFMPFSPRISYQKGNQPIHPPRLPQVPTYNINIVFTFTCKGLG